VTRPLQSQVAVITGGLGGIGRAIAVELAGRGADIAVCDIKTDGAQVLIEAVEAQGRRCRVDRVDVTDPVAVRAWLTAVGSYLGLPTLIVPNAATADAGALSALEPEQWRRELAVNLDSALYVAMLAARDLIAAQCPGRIVFIGSWAASQVHPAIPTYCVAKAGLRMLMRCMALEYASHGILVNEVAPGYVNAGLGAVGPEQAVVLNHEVPIREMAVAEDVALQVAHLCDPQNRHMTGSTVLMDGGLSLLGRPPPAG
jgi:NAD(P)-dependent dehydrogenase (short-subunit alcohol dehydrogenase family)